MATLQAIWSNGLLFATVSSAAVSLLLMVACFIAGLCPCEKAPEQQTESAEASPIELVDYSWMRAA